MVLFNILCRKADDLFQSSITFLLYYYYFYSIIAILKFKVFNSKQLNAKYYLTYYFSTNTNYFSHSTKRTHVHSPTKKFHQYFITADEIIVSAYSESASLILF